jgi:dihydrodipicolinate synthase/N-acetylneuraminate lyase
VTAALAILGVLESARVRLPLVEVTSDEQAQVKAALDAAGLLAASA